MPDAISRRVPTAWVVHPAAPDTRRRATPRPDDGHRRPVVAAATYAYPNSDEGRDERAEDLAWNSTMLLDPGFDDIDADLSDLVSHGGPRFGDDRDH